MRLFVLLAALIETISDTIKEKVNNKRTLEERRRYENIDFNNIKSVTLDYTETAYRTYEEEEFDIVASNFLSEMDGWPHYETKTVKYEVKNGENYCFTIKYKNGTESYRKLHETSPLTVRLLKYCSDEDNGIATDGPVASRFYEIVKDSLKLLETTTNPNTYFSRYETALDSAKRLVETTQVPYYNYYALDVISDLTQNRSEKIKEFVDRCNSKGSLYSIKDRLLSNEYDVPSKVKEYIRSLLEEREKQAASSPKSDEYIYCSVAFTPNGQTYYYKTTDETLKIGDEVRVLVGPQQEEKIAKITKIERFSISKAPYPPSQTKDIMGRSLR